MRQTECLTWGLVSRLSRRLFLHLFLHSSSSFSLILSHPSPHSSPYSEAQVRSIANHVRPDRQSESHALFCVHTSPTPSPPPLIALLFSATFRKKVERLCRDSLTDPVRIVVGDVGEANTDITQLVTVLPEQTRKWVWLLSHLVEFMSGEELVQ